MKKQIISSVFAVLLLASCGQSNDPKARMDSYIDSLMSEMTLEEKLGQINLLSADAFSTGAPVNSDIEEAVRQGTLGNVLNIKGAEKIRELQRVAVEESRLGIPLLIGMDVIHGYETIFPIPLALASSWDIDEIEQSARVAATEASAAGVNWTYSPMVDIARDPRWGRMAEGAGEDPYLGSQIARAMVRGFQGDLNDSTEILACLKHYALYGGAEGGRDYNTVDMSRNRMFNEYLAPYKAAVEEGVATVMTSFNLIDGIPATANDFMINDVLRDQWGFDGMVVTDYGSIGEMKNHGIAELPEASAQALQAGTDMDMCSFGFIGTLKESLENGRVSQKDIDQAVRRVLEAKYKVGILQNPYKFNDVEREKTDIYNDKHRAAARRIAAKTLVLLKNDNNILPLDKKGKIALIGPLANSAANMPGTWAPSADASKYKTLKQGFEDAVAGKAEIVYAKGANLDSNAALEAAQTWDNRAMRDPRSDDELLAEALRVAAGADVIVAAMGEGNDNAGESSARSIIQLPNNQRRLLKALLATGKPVVMLNFAGRATVMDWELENMPSILNVWFAGSEGPDAIADVVFGDVNPSGKLTVSMPYNTGQIPVYYNHMNTGRPDWDPTSFQRYTSNYIDIPNDALLPIGYGLSYTTFDYSDFKIDSDHMSKDGSIKASVTVTNTGNRPGQEVVQFYTRDILASVARPVKELKHFEKISLEPGESKTVEFNITEDDLKFYNRNLEYVAEPGEFLIMAGPNSRDVQTLTFTID